MTKFVGIVFAFIGAVLLIGAIASSVINYRFLQTASTAQGSVVKLNAGGSHPEIKFTTDAGGTIQYPQGGLIAGYEVGDKVTVFYDSKNPREASIDSIGAIWATTIFLSSPGIVFTVVGLLNTFGFRRFSV